jgi:hypothetical protein
MAQQTVGARIAELRVPALQQLGQFTTWVAMEDLEVG